MLRPFEDEDIERVYEACQDEEIGRFTATLPSPYTRADAAGWIAAHDSLRMDGTGLDLAIDLDEVGLAGSIGLTTFDCARSRSRTTPRSEPPSRPATPTSALSTTCTGSSPRFAAITVREAPPAQAERSSPLRSSTDTDTSTRAPAPGAVSRAIPDVTRSARRRQTASSAGSASGGS